VADIDIVCGRYGACCGQSGLWPISFVADMVVAVWPIWFVAVIVVSRYVVSAETVNCFKNKIR